MKQPIGNKSYQSFVRAISSLVDEILHIRTIVFDYDRQLPQHRHESPECLPDEVASEYQTDRLTLEHFPKEAPPDHFD